MYSMKTALIIEDNPDIRENTAEILELAGFKVLSVENGKKGLVAASEHMPDIILCDIMMPEVNGYEVLENLKKNTLTAAIPFIYITASAEKSEEQRAMDMGADGYICKPFDVDTLMDTIEVCIDKNSTR